MSLSQPPESNERQSLAEQALGFGRRLIAPHASVIEAGVFSRAQLLNSITMALLAVFILGINTRPRFGYLFDFMFGISLLALLLGKSKYPQAGAILFSAGCISLTYLSLYLGFTADFTSTVFAFVPLALIIASALTSEKIFIRLALSAAVLTTLASFYTEAPVLTADITQASAVVLFTGLLLYGVLLFRANAEKTHMKELRKVNQDLLEVKAGLEGRIDERTQELGKTSLQVQEGIDRLQTVLDISAGISAGMEKQPAELLTEITSLISEKMGFYHVGIFILDEKREYALLRAANSPGGQRMLERHHRLKVGGTGIVGYVSHAGRPRIALDTGLDAVFFNNPDLPKTRSELALPLKFGTDIIGVLDAQSTQSSAIKDEDINILAALANQISVVVHNLTAGELPGQTVPSRAVKFIGRKQTSEGYQYLPDGTISTGLPQNNLTLEKAIASGETEIIDQPSKGISAALAVPVKLRNQMIGVIHIQAADENRRWTEDEILLVQSISDRAALALENARLFEETTRRAEQEEAITRVTTQIGASSDFDHIMQTTIQELGIVLGASRSYIHLGVPSENGKDRPSEADS